MTVAHKLTGGHRVATYNDSVDSRRFFKGILSVTTNAMGVHLDAVVPSSRTGQFQTDAWSVAVAENGMVFDVRLPVKQLAFVGERRVTTRDLCRIGWCAVPPCEKNRKHR